MMSTGMLWYDGSAREPSEKLVDAAKAYLVKYGVAPFRAIVGVKRGDAKDGQSTVCEGIQVEFTHRVSVCHITLWGDPPPVAPGSRCPEPYDRGANAGNAHARFQEHNR